MVKQIPVDCLHVFREISNYIDGDIAPADRARMEAHFKVCAHCVAVLDGSRNVVRLIGDGRAFDVPAGFRSRLYSKLESYLAKEK